MTYFDDVAVGDHLPEVRITVDETQMFLFSAATYNAHRIHYDKDWAREREGYDDVLVQGPLQAALLARAVTNWIGGDGRLLRFSAQSRATGHPGEQLTFGGTVTDTDPSTATVELDLAGRRGDSLLMPGAATVVLPRRGEVPR